MYVLATLKDKIKVMPHNFQDDMSVPVIDEINRRYCNKVRRRGRRQPDSQPFALFTQAPKLLKLRNPRR